MPALTKNTALKAAKRAIFFLLAFSIAVAINATAQELEYVGSCELPYRMASVYVVGDYAYMAQANFGLRIVSIADPTNPEMVGSYETAQSDPEDVIVRNDYAYLVGWGRFLYVIDVSDPINPAYSGGHSTLSASLSIYLRGGYAYLGESKYLEIFNITNPAAPYQVGYYDYGNMGPCLTGISVAGDYAYVASNSSPLPCLHGWCYLDIFNISDPHEPTLVSSLSLGGEGPWDVFVAGGYAYVCDWASGSALYIVDVADPADPNIVGGWQGPEGSFDIFLSGPYAYLICSGRMVFMVNIADPANPILVTIYDTPHAAADIMVVGEYVYVANYESLLILRFVNVPCEGAYIPGDCNSNGYPLQLADVMAMIGLYRGNILPGFTCDCSPHGHIFAPQADPNGNCVAYELVDVVTEIAAYRGLGTVSGCQDCPPTE